jgi:hypothetical protein
MSNSCCRFNYREVTKRNAMDDAHELASPLCLQFHPENVNMSKHSSPAKIIIINTPVNNTATQLREMWRKSFSGISHGRLRCTIMTAIFRWLTRVSLQLWLCPCLGFSIFRSPISPGFLWNTHSAIHISRLNSRSLAVKVAFVLSCSICLVVEIQWSHIWNKLLRSTKNACGGCSTCHGFCKDVGCWGMRVGRTGYFSRSYSLTRQWPFGFFRTWACFEVRCSVTPVVETWGGPQIPIFL